MARMYTIVFSGVAVAVQQDFFSFRPVADKPCELHAVFLANVSIQGTSGDAKEELLGVEIVRGNTTIGSGGTNPTAQPTNAGDTAFGPTTNVRVNDTTKVSAGTRNLLHADGFNTRSGWIYVPTPEMRVRVSNADGYLAVQLVETPAASITLSGTAYVLEL